VRSAVRGEYEPRIAELEGELKVVRAALETAEGTVEQQREKVPLCVRSCPQRLQCTSLHCWSLFCTVLVYGSSTLLRCNAFYYSASTYTAPPPRNLHTRTYSDPPHYTTHSHPYTQAHAHFHSQITSLEASLSASQSECTSKAADVTSLLRAKDELNALLMAAKDTGPSAGYDSQ
jgi:hypothetical protein